MLISPNHPQIAGMPFAYKYMKKKIETKTATYTPTPKGSMLSAGTENYTSLKSQEEYLIISDSLKAKCWKNKRI